MTTMDSHNNNNNNTDEAKTSSVCKYAHCLDSNILIAVIKTADSIFFAVGLFITLAIHNVPAAPLSNCYNMFEE